MLDAINGAPVTAQMLDKALRGMNKLSSDGRGCFNDRIGMILPKMENFDDIPEQHGIDLGSAAPSLGRVGAADVGWARGSDVPMLRWIIASFEWRYWKRRQACHSWTRRP